MFRRLQFPGPIAPAILDWLSNLFVLKVGLQRLVLSGRVRTTLTPLLSTPQLVGSVQVSALILLVHSAWKAAHASRSASP